MNNEKKEKRREIRQQLGEISQHHWEEVSRELCSLLADWLLVNPEFKKVATYSALPTEVDLSFCTVLAPGIEWHYPVVNGSKMSFHRVTDKRTLEAGYAGILEPNPQVHPPILPETLDLVICPGLGFTSEGERLGRGGGFYDRFLSTVPTAKRLGVCLREQILPSLPMENFDIRMTHLLTIDGVKKVAKSNEGYIG